MAFPFGAVIGGLTSLIGGASQAASQRAEIRRQEAIAQDRLDFDRRVYDWQNLVSQTQYQYDQMRVDALRAADAQAGADYARQQEMLIEQAVANYEINQGAIVDRYIKEERLRAKQDQIEFRNANRVAERNLREEMRRQRVAQKANDIQMQAATDENVIQQDRLGLEASEIARRSSYEAAQNGLRMAEQVRSFMQQGRIINNAADLAARRAEAQVSEVMTSIALEEGADNYGWQLQQIQAMLEDGQVGAMMSARQGGGATARRLSIASAQALGRTWGQQVLNSRSRGVRVNLINDLINKQLATESAGQVLQLQNLQDQAAYSVATGKLANTNIIQGARQALRGTEIQSDASMKAFARAMERGQLQFDDSQGAQAFALKAFAQDWRQRNRVMSELKIPSYRLARRQGVREAQSLFLRTKSVFDQASIPYRGGVFFDPVAPIPGPGPEQSGTANFQSPGFGQIVASNLAGAAGQAVAGQLGNMLQGNLFSGGGSSVGQSFNSVSFNPSTFNSGFNSGFDIGPALSIAQGLGTNLGGVGNVNFNPGAFSGGSLL